MCGIAGIWSSPGRRASTDVLASMLGAIVHRGPEGASFARVAGGELVLGFLMLGFTDTATGQQPLFNEDHTIALVYNGEIYDYEVLRDELIGLGHRFRTRSDSEVVLHLWQEYGPACFERMNGEFAFALWDGRTQELILARDRFGLRPLLYATHDGAVLFASESKALLTVPGLARALSPDFYCGPGVGLAASTLTTFHGISSVRPGHFRRISRTGTTETAYWRPAFGGSAHKTFADATDAVRSELSRAVTRRVAGGVPIGLSLSSGLDSSLVAGLMGQVARSEGRRFTAFSLSYPGAPYDESAQAERTAKHHGLDFAPVPCPIDALANGLVASIYSTEVATNSLSTVARMRLMAAARASGLKAVASGEGSDELFGGYPYFRLERIWRLRTSASAEERATGERAWVAFQREEASSEGVFWDRGEGWRTAASAYALRLARIERQVPWMFARSWRCERGRPTALFDQEFAPHSLRSLHPFNATRVLSRGILGSVVIPALDDRVEMSASLEGRAPYLDSAMIALAYSLPEAWCLSDDASVSKRVLRAAGADLLPPGFTPPPKHTLMAPSFRALSATRTGRELLDTHLGRAAIKRAGIFSPNVVSVLERLWRVLPAPSPRFALADGVVGFVLGVQILNDVFVDRFAPPAPLRLIDDRSPS